MQPDQTILTRPSAARSSIWLLVGLVALCLAVGIAGSFFTRDAVVTWYPTLERPSWTPPNWVFGPVWTMLYVLIGIAGWRVLRVAGAHAAMTTWWIQLALNAIWSPLFFGAHALGAAFIVITLLWFSILRFVWLSRRVDRLASALFVPYLAWVSFAASLNFAIWIAN